MTRVHRRFLALVALYVLLDFGNPFMPGAFEFDLADSVTGLQQERQRPDVPLVPDPAPLACPVVGELALFRPTEPLAVPPPRAAPWLPRLSLRADTSGREPSPGPDAD